MKKAPSIALLATVLSLMLAGCSFISESEPTPEPEAPAQEETAVAPVKTGVIVDYGNLSIIVPEEWGITDLGAGGMYIYPSYYGLLFIAEDTTPTQGIDNADYYADIIADIEASGMFSVDDSFDRFWVGQADVFRSAYSYSTGEANLEGWMEIVFYGGRAYRVMFAVSEDIVSSKESEILEVLDSLEVHDYAPLTDPYVASAPESEVAPEPEQGADGATPSQANALATANSYLNFIPFSRTGLIEQLQYEGYSYDDAVYAVDHCGADWMAQAEGKARSYVNSIPFSRAGLIEQLEYEGFTFEEAVYGADHCGADWFEQAALKAKSYLQVFDFSHDALVDQLEYEGFTSDQAEYGVTAAGL